MNGSIVVVGDTHEDLGLLEECLVAEGCAVRPFSNGEHAICSMQVEIPDLVVIDIDLLGCDGYKVCQQIKLSDTLQDIPVIFTGGATVVENRICGFQVGAVDFITKPYQREELIARISAHLTLHDKQKLMRSVQERLRRDNGGHKLAQAIARLGHWEWYVDSGKIRWSDETYRLLGYTSQNFVPNHDYLLQVVHPDDREAVTKYLEQLMGSSGFDAEFRIVQPDGVIRVLHSVCRAGRISGSGQPEFLAGSFEETKREALLFVGVIQDITERKELEQRLEAEANTDALTGCVARRHFLELAQREIARNSRHPGALSLLMIDLDNFKHINDRYGHHIGDLALKSLAHLCRETLRGVDVIGRLGGDEFAVLLPDTSCKLATEVAERLRKAIATMEVPLDDEQSMHFTASIGVSMLEHANATLDELLTRADRALYAAKETGRNRVHAHAGEGGLTVSVGEEPRHARPVVR